MNNNQRKVLLATLLALVGIGLAWRSIGRSRRLPPTPQSSQTPPEIRDTLNRLRLDTQPTAQTAAITRVKAHDVLSERLSDVERLRPLYLNQRQIEDLQDAFSERIFALACDDFDDITAELHNRGVILVSDEQERARWRLGRDWLGSPPQMGLEQISVIPLYDRGQPLQPEPLDEGWDIFRLSYQQSMMPIGKDAVLDKLTVVEVRLPMTLKGIKSGDITVLPAGFCFAWSEKRVQWIPWEIRVYEDREDRQPYAGVVFR